MNENVTDRLNKTTVLSDGTVITPAVPDPVRLRRDVMPNPLHSTTESTMAPTSEFARYFLLALPSRYVFRSAIGALSDPEAPNWIKGPVDKLLDRISVNKISAKLGQVLKEHPLQGLGDATDVSPKIIEDLLDPAANGHLTEQQRAANATLRAKVSKILTPWSAGSKTNEVVELAYKRAANSEKGLGIGSKAKDLIRNASRKHMGQAAYGAILGVASSALTITYAGMVYKDIKNIFAEAVGFEFNKAPEDVTFNDIRSSKNELVQQTLNNYWKKTAERVLTDLPFFASVRFPNLQLADMMIGVKGLQLFGESWRRRNTMFEDLVTMVNDKINPYNGLGQPISTAEVFDLYQHYHYNRKSGPDQTFNTIIERNTADSQVWAKSQRVFSRIADLMNQTYAYKHESELGVDGTLQVRAHFALPQFIYMLGHNLIDPKDPEHTLAYIETANSYGMQAVKEVQQMFAAGMPVEAVIARFPIDRNLPSNKNLHDGHPLPDPRTAPHTQVQNAGRTLEGRAEALLKNMMPSMA